MPIPKRRPTAEFRLRVRVANEDAEPDDLGTREESVTLDALAEPYVLQTVSKDGGVSRAYFQFVPDAPEPELPEFKRPGRRTP